MGKGKMLFSSVAISQHIYSYPLSVPRKYLLPTCRRSLVFCSLTSSKSIPRSHWNLFEYCRYL